MQIECFSGFAKKPNSTRQPSSGTVVNVTLKEPTSVLDPVFIIQNYNLSWNYIKWGERYYYVRDTVIVHNNIAEFHCQSDSWATFKSDIGASRQYVLRADSTYNLFITDTKYPTKAETEVTNISFSTLHSEFVNGGSFVIGIVNGINVASGGVSYYCLTASEMKDLLDFMFGGTWLDATEISLELQKELVNPFQYIDSLTWFPFNVPDSDVPFSPEHLKFGFWDYTGLGGLLDPNNATKGFAQQITIPNHPQYARGYYLNGYPFTRLMLNCYCFGSIPVDPSYFITDSKLTLGLSVDFISGMGKLTLREGTDGNLIHQTYAQVGVPMKVSQVSQSVLGAVGNVLGGSVGIRYGNVVGYAQGVVSGLQSLMPQVSSSGANGSKSAFVTAPELIISRQELSPEDKTQMGRPLCEAVTISSLSGFVLCENADLDTSASPSEKAEIINGMNTGFYYE